MSLKIFTGFQLTTTSWPDVHHYVMAFRQELAAVAHETRSREFARIVADLVDAAVLNSGPWRPNGVYMDVLETFVEHDKGRRSGFSLLLIPEGRRILGRTFGPDAHAERWLAKPFVKRFGYWTNTDRPEEVSEAEWRGRGRCWNRILGDRTWEMCGFVAQCLPDEGPIPSPEEVLAALPDLETRCQIQARDRQQTSWFLLHGADADPGAFLAHFKSAAGAQERADLAAAIRPLLRPITRDDLFRTHP